MMGRAILLALGLSILAIPPVMAGAPEASLLPVARPVDGTGARPDFVTFVRGAPGVSRSLRPQARPRFLKGLPVGAQPPEHLVPVATRRAGSVCRSREIRGQRLASIPGKLRGCGLANPVRVEMVSGVALNRSAIMDCTTAKALNKWVKNGVKPAIGRRGGGLTGLRVIADYSCRTRNNKPGAKISEHGRGRAIDIAAFTLANGRAITVLDGWRKPRDKKLLKRLHRAACGPFGTVLGPNADRYHVNHFHLDTARYRGGAYCR